MTDFTIKKLEVYFDGSCPLCAAEISHYKQLDRKGYIKFTDISEAAEQIAADLTKKEAMARFHVRVQDHKFLSGAPAFIALWRLLPRWRVVAKIMALPGLTQFADLMYRGFLFIRPVLVWVFVLSRKSSIPPDRG